MLLTLLLVAGAVGATYAAPKAYKKVKPKPPAIKPSEWCMKPTLDEREWAEFIRCIKEECKGWKLTNNLIQSVFDTGFRFSCAQIYELISVYTSKFHDKKRSDLLKMLQYEITAKGEAQEKIQRLILDLDDTAARKRLLSKRG